MCVELLRIQKEIDYNKLEHSKNFNQTFKESNYNRENMNFKQHRNSSLKGLQIVKKKQWQNKVWDLSINAFYYLNGKFFFKEHTLTHRQTHKVVGDMKNKREKKK